jgi:hypothetical protein
VLVQERGGGDRGTQGALPSAQEDTPPDPQRAGGRGDRDVRPGVAALGRCPEGEPDGGVGGP